MQSAASNPAKIPEFYRALLDSELYILTPEAELELGGRRSLKPHEAINIATVEFQGKPWHPAFTAPERVSAYLKEPETCLEAKARDLFQLLPPGSLAILNANDTTTHPGQNTIDFMVGASGSVGREQRAGVTADLHIVGDRAVRYHSFVIVPPGGVGHTRG